MAVAINTPRITMIASKPTSDAPEACRLASFGRAGTTTTCDYHAPPRSHQ